MLKGQTSAPDSDLVHRTAAPTKAPPKKRVSRKKTPEQVLAARHGGAKPEQVEKCRVEDHEVVYLINWGIKGTKKYKVLLSEFRQKAAFFQ